MYPNLQECKGVVEVVVEVVEVVVEVVEVVVEIVEVVVEVVEVVVEVVEVEVDVVGLEVIGGQLCGGQDVVSGPVNEWQFNPKRTCLSSFTRNNNYQNNILR